MSQSGADVPNILWFSVHDINPDLGCYAGVWPGAEYARTPNLDRLAADGARYDNAFAVAPVCAPSRSAIVTGMYPTAIGTMHMRSRAVPPPEVRCFPEYLRAAGYYCTNNFFTDYQFQTPVTVWDDNGPQAHWRRPARSGPAFLRRLPQQPSRTSRRSTSTTSTYERNTAALTPEQRHDPALAPLPPYYPDTRSCGRPGRATATTSRRWTTGPAELLDELDADGLADNTLVVFWSDHGRGMPRAKRWPYEAGLHEPLLVRWPGRIAPGHGPHRARSLMDLGPTMLAAAGLPVPAQMHGRPLFDAPAPSHASRVEYVFGHSDRMTSTADTMRTVRDARFRYIRNHHPDRPYLQHQDYSEQFSTWRELRRLQFEETLHHRGRRVTRALTDAQRDSWPTASRPRSSTTSSPTPMRSTTSPVTPRTPTDLDRLRGALDTWQQTYGDLGLIPRGGADRTLAAGRRRAGDRSAAAHRGRRAGTAECPTPGASIAWTADPPSPDAASRSLDRRGGVRAGRRQAARGPGRAVRPEHRLVRPPADRRALLASLQRPGPGRGGRTPGSAPAGWAISTAPTYGSRRDPGGGWRTGWRS